MYLNLCVSCLIFIILQIDSLGDTQDTDENGKGDPQKDTYNKAGTSSDCEKQGLTPSEPKPLAESKEEIAKIERKDGLTPQPGDGKSHFHFQCSHLENTVSRFVTTTMLQSLCIPIYIKNTAIWNQSLNSRWLEEQSYGHSHTTQKAKPTCHFTCCPQPVAQPHPSQARPRKRQWFWYLGGSLDKTVKIDRLLTAT